jgi:hypothetical protein
MDAGAREQLEELNQGEPDNRREPQDEAVDDTASESGPIPIDTTAEPLEHAKPRGPRARGGGRHPGRRSQHAEDDRAEEAHAPSNHPIAEERPLTVRLLRLDHLAQPVSRRVVSSACNRSLGGASAQARRLWPE